MRQPFVPENCVTCNCGDDEYCPYDSGEVDELGRPMCGEGVNNCINGPDPLMCIECDSDSGTAEFGSTCTVSVSECAEEIFMSRQTVTCNGMAFTQTQCTSNDYGAVGQVCFSGVIGFDNHPENLQDDGFDCDIVPNDVVDADGHIAQTLDEGVCSGNPPTCNPPINVVFPSPSPSPSTQPIYQIQIAEMKTLCVTDPCIERFAWDNYTTQINIWYERAVTDTSTGLTVLTQPPIDDLQFLPAMEDIVLYAKTLTQCYDPQNTIQCERAALPNLPDFRRERLLLFCEPCINEEWVPTWYITPEPYEDIPAGTDYHPTIVEGGVYPNFQTHQVIAGVVDCLAIQESELFSQFESIKYVTYPMGPTRLNPDGSVFYDDDGQAEGGPCWDDPDYGRLVCANGGGGLPPGTLDWPSEEVPTPMVRDINGVNFPQEMDENNQYPRHMQFNCPQGSGGKKTDDELLKLMF